MAKPVFEFPVPKFWQIEPLIVSGIRRPDSKSSQVQRETCQHKLPHCFVLPLPAPPYSACAPSPLHHNPPHYSSTYFDRKRKLISTELKLNLKQVDISELLNKQIDVEYCFCYSKRNSWKRSFIVLQNRNHEKFWQVVEIGLTQYQLKTPKKPQLPFYFYFKI